MNVKDTVLEVVYAVLPITIVILVMQAAVVKFPPDILMRFIAGVVMVMLGLIFFFLGLKLGILEVGERIGTALTLKGKLWLLLLFGFVLGFVIAVADPDVQVLANQVADVSNGAIARQVLIIFVALGVGIFIALALLRAVLNIPLAYMLIGGYAFAFLLAIFTQPQFVPVSFDAGGVATGPMLVPFILALGVGVSAITRSRKESDDSFGMVGLASLGPIIAVLILGVVYR